jgi:lipoprotein-anchoring transpeptidase ErfK/SrfK
VVTRPPARARTRAVSRGALAAAALVAIVGTAAAAWAGLRAKDARDTRDAARAALAADMRKVDDARRARGAVDDTLRSLLATGSSDAGAPVIVVSLADNRLWVRQEGEVVYSTRIASGSGRTLVAGGGKQRYKFDTPRGKLTVLSKETSPRWAPPDWHFVEKAGKKGLGLLRMQPGQVIPVSGGVITTRGRDIVRRTADGSIVPLAASDGREIVVGNKVLIPPGGYNQRRYPEVLGTHRLNLGDGYALHGTNAPSSIGRSVSHGCVRLRNEDIETLYRMIPVGTPVYIY